MIVDCFPFYNELELLQYRLETLSSVVDKFVLVESPRTFRGNPKKLYYKENKHLFEKYSDKIVHVIDGDLLEDPPSPWMNEAHQRNYTRVGADSLGLGPGDIVLLSDVDEIFNPEVIKNIDTLLGQNLFVNMNMDLYYYNIETKLDLDWPAAKATRYSYFRTIYPQVLRGSSDGPVIPNAGWHLSYFGSPKMIINKLKNFAHSEYSEVYGLDDDERVRDIINNGHDLIERSGEKVKFIHVPTENNPRLPPNYKTICMTVEEYDRRL